MTIENLKHIKVLDELIHNKLLEVERLKALATKVTYATEGERVQTSSCSDNVADNVAKIVSLEHEINDIVNKFINLKKECMDWIDSLDDYLVIGILYKKYLHYKTWEQIAEEMNISSRWAQEIHKRFISSL